MKNTQRKWKVMPAKAAGKILYYEIGEHGGNQHFATVIDNEYLNISMNGAKANAHLIAAAPELLEALKEVLDRGLTLSKPTILLAIKKAEGK